MTLHAHARLVNILLVAPFTVPLIRAVGITAHEVLSWSWLSSITALPLSRMLLFQIMVASATMMYSALAIRSRDHRPFFTLTHGMLLVYFLILVGTSLVSSDVRFAFLNDTERADGLVFLAHVGVYNFLLTWMIHNRTRFAWFLRFAVVSGILTLLVLTVDAIIVHRPLLSIATWHTQGTTLLGNMNFFAHWILLLLVANGHAIFVVSQPYAKTIAVILLSFLVISASSTAILLGSVFLLWMIWRTQKWLAYSIVLVGLSVALTVQHATNHDIFLESLTSLKDSTAIRLDLWKSGVSTMATHRLVVGYGWGNLDLLWNDLQYDTFAKQRSPYSQYRYDRLHSLPLDWLAAAGILGLTAGLVVVVHFLFLTLQIRRREHNAAGSWMLSTLLVMGAYIAWNFDTLMSYSFTALVIAGFVLHAEEQKMLPHHFRSRVLQRIVAVSATILAGSSLLFFGVQPLRAASLSTQAAFLAAATEVDPDPALAMNAVRLLERSASIKHPFVMLRRDSIDIGMRLAQQPIHVRLRTVLYEQLLTNANALTALHPQNPHLLHRLAWIHGQFRNYDAEENALAAAVRLAPRNGTLRFQYASAALRRQHYVVARQIFTQFLKEEIFQNASTFSLGLLDILQGDPYSGQRTITHALVSYAPTTLEWQQLSEALQQTLSPLAIAAWYQRLEGFVGFATIQGLREEQNRMQSTPLIPFN
jgi:tetratricopeptide (TPR) repeat protein